MPPPTDKLSKKTIDKRPYSYKIFNIPLFILCGQMYFWRERNGIAARGRGPLSSRFTGTLSRGKVVN